MRIAMPRGDVRYERFIIKDPYNTDTDENTEHPELDFDEVYFTVKKTRDDRDFIFQKSLKNGTINKLAPGDYQLRINPEDTNNLKYGQYIFDVQVSLNNGTLKETFVGQFDLLSEVTFQCNE